MTNLTHSPYDPRQITTDGPFTAERRWLHAQKVLIGFTVYAIAWAFVAGLVRTAPVIAGIAAAWPRLALWLPAIVGGPGTLAGAIVKEWRWPTDPARYPIALVLDDHLTDGACYSACLAVHCFALGAWLAAPLVAAALFAIYRTFRHGARP